MTNLVDLQKKEKKEVKKTRFYTQDEIEWVDNEIKEMKLFEKEQTSHVPIPIMYMHNKKVIRLKKGKHWSNYSVIRNDDGTIPFEEMAPLLKLWENWKFRGERLDSLPKSAPQVVSTSDVSNF